jgi:tetratricopeptide (TPR) repeat protein
MIYLEKTFWPHDLTIFYPFFGQLPLWQVLGAVLLILVISATVILMVKRFPYLFVGWLWYTITILPVIGIIPVGNNAMADRYIYLPSIGIAIMLAWGISSFINNDNLRKKILFPAAIAFLAILSILTWKQCGYWRNSTTLFRHALSLTKDNYLAHDYFANALVNEGKIGEAIDHLNEAIHIKPDYVNPYNNRGTAYGNLGQYQLAMEDFNKAISILPTYVDAYYNRGLTYTKFGHYQQAIEDYNKAIDLNPTYIKAYNNKGIAYANLGQYQLAIKDFNEAIKLKQDYADAYNNRGIVYAKLGQNHRAIEDYNRAIRLQPDYVSAYYNRRNAYNKLGQNQRADEDWNQVIRLSHKKPAN